ncbi:glycerol-3-phosphate 1-O-acyltransferase PlsY [candidate division WOR-3 bacterium]|nr:glycerol-3-phosphate 1-O-acyltransferase PlsY [candidate division WOR-3 bacterium]
MAFFIGGIPFGLLISKLYGKDPRKEGSKNIGATNVLRTVGVLPGLITFTLDILKGLLPVLAVKILVGKFYYDDLLLFEFSPSATALGAVLGHIFSPYLKFKGGKGVATGLGTIIVLTPLLSVVCFLVFVLILTFSRIVSVGSIIAALSYASLLTAIKLMKLPLSQGEFYYGIATAVFVVFSHRKNISRILKGQETKFSWKKER